MAAANAKDKWGPPIWQYLHLMTFLYPQKPTETDQTQYAALFAAVANTLPCDTCRTHFKTHIQSDEFKKALINKEELMLAKWLVDVHNSVNERLNKPKKSFAAVRQEYEILCKNMHCGIPSAEKPPSNTKNATSSSPQTTMIICLSIVGVLGLWGLYHLFRT